MLEIVLQRGRVRLLALLGELADRVVDAPAAAVGEMLGLQQFADFFKRAVVREQGGEQPHLDFEIVRRDARRRLVGRAGGERATLLGREVSIGVATIGASCRGPQTNCDRTT